jgi:hypothetical protein
MKDLSTTLNTAELSSKTELVYELVHVNSINLVLTETVPKNKKTSQSRFYQRAKF